jgi:DNA repair protein RadC
MAAISEACKGTVMVGKFPSCVLNLDMSFNAVDVNVRRVVENALRQRASYVILAHNHPSGNLRPSVEDDSLTSSLYHALQTVGLNLEDHLILTTTGHFSYKDSGTLSLIRFQNPTRPNSGYYGRR